VSRSRTFLNLSSPAPLNGTFEKASGYWGQSHRMERRYADPLVASWDPYPGNYHPDAFRTPLGFVACTLRGDDGQKLIFRVPFGRPYQMLRWRLKIRSARSTMQGPFGGASASWQRRLCDESALSQRQCRSHWRRGEALTPLAIDDAIRGR
jgi:hypothetical protein